jgi:hypothetical protein
MRRLTSGKAGPPAADEREVRTDRKANALGKWLRHARAPVRSRAPARGDGLRQEGALLPSAGGEAPCHRLATNFRPGVAA